MSMELTTLDQQSLALATELAKSELLPPHLKGKPASVFLLMGLAHQLGVAPMMVFQKVAVISGKPALGSELMIALLNRSGKIKGTVRYKWFGEEGRPDRGCVASAMCAETGEMMEGQPITLALAQKSGWMRNQLWMNMPDTMLRHRAAAWLVRQYWPDVLLGLQEENEVRDVDASPRDVTPAGSARERLAMLRAQAAPEAETPPVVDEVVEKLPGEAATPAAVETVDEVLSDFLMGVGEATDSGELTSMVGQSRGFEQEAQVKAAQKAIVARSKTLGLTWSKTSNSYITNE